MLGVAGAVKKPFTKKIMKTILTSVALCALGIQLQAQVSFTLSSTPYPGSYPQGVRGGGCQRGRQAGFDQRELERQHAFRVDQQWRAAALWWPARLSRGHSILISFVAADVNGDGKLDMICAN